MAKNKMKKDKRSRASLRVDKDLHGRLARVASKLKLKVNGAMNLMLVRWLSVMEIDAVVIEKRAKQSKELGAAFAEWKKDNHARTRRDFHQEYIKYLLGMPSSVTEEHLKAPPRRRRILPDVDGPVTFTNRPASQTPVELEDGDDF